MPDVVLRRALTCLLVLFLIGYVLARAAQYNLGTASTSPAIFADSIGILPDLMNTLYIVIATILIVVPLGVGAAIYLKRRSSQNWWW